MPAIALRAGPQTGETVDSLATMTGKASRMLLGCRVGRVGNEKKKVEASAAGRLPRGSSTVSHPETTRGTPIRDFVGRCSGSGGTFGRPS